MRTRRTKEQIRKDNYNKDVDAYNFYVVNLDTKRAETGFEFKEDAVDVLNDYDDKKKYKVVSKRALKSMGVENPNESFKYEGGGDLQNIAFTYGKMLNDLSKEKQFNKKMEKNGIINRYAKQHDITIDNNNIIYIKGERIAYIDKINQKTGQSKSNWEIKKFEFGGDFQSGVYAKGGGVENNRVKVGVFSSEDLKSDVFLKAWEKKSKETGLTNIDLKAINKGGKTFIELYLIPNKSDSDVKIKDWYMKNYPTDDLGEELNDEVTFEDMWNEDYKKYNVYQVMGVGDSVIRERLFEHLAEIKGVSYDVVYKKLFLTGNYAKGGSLIGNQKRIDLNKNGKIDAEDFKLLRTTMNGAWRNEHEHINSSDPKQDYEVRYARKNKSDRTGYKGKTNFATGGGVDRFSEYSNDALYDMIINLSRYENTESDIQMVKAELEKRKGQNKGVIEEMDLTDDKRLRLRKPVMPERKYSEREWAEKFNPRAYEFMGKRKMATGGSIKMVDGKMYEKIKFSNGIEDWYRADFLHRVNFYCSQNGLNPNNQKDFEKALENVSKKSFSTGGKTTFKEKSSAIAKKFEGKRVEPKYQKEYGKVYSKEEAKEVGNKITGSMVANQKMATGGETKKGARGGIMTLAKKIRKDGEKWTDAVKRAGQQLK